MLRCLLTVALLIQCFAILATSLPEDYHYDGSLSQDEFTVDQFSRYPSVRSDYDTQGGALLADIVDEFSDTEWVTESDSARESSAWDLYPGATGDNADWESFTMQEGNTLFSGESELSTFASTESVGMETLIDSSAVTNPLSSFADDTAFTQPAHDRDADDEVFFDTSGADMVYKASDDGELSLAAADVMLESLAAAPGGCGTGNPIDDCWRCDRNWRSHRKSLATCVTGFGRGTVGGKNGPIYVVTNSSDDGVDSGPGTLRYGVTRSGPLWIIFKGDMTIRLAAELWVNSFKTIDGRGADVHIVGAQITIQNATNVIVHGISIHDSEVTGPSSVRVSPTKVVVRVESDGDGLHILNSQKVWVDHCYLANATDGLLDATRGSNFITVSNNLFENHNKVMLFGSSPDFPQDRKMRATVIYNRFGVGLIQRLPRCRYGAFHIVNNHYSEGWDKYAIGGSEDPMILSHGNVFNAGAKKEVTKHIDDAGPTFGGWQNWDWASSGDIFLNDAFFTGSGANATKSKLYAKAFSTTPRPAILVPAMTKSAGPILSY
ncbi:hypothetical protein M758_4G186900 [Ceratodon purpureus]|nr:hypothetical protein M758_4G186900 [Ceratodon purpureus]